MRPVLTPPSLPARDRDGPQEEVLTSASRQTPTLPGPQAVPGNPNQEAPRWRFFSLQLSHWPLSPPTGWKPAAHTHVCPSDVEACGPGLPCHSEAGCVSTDPSARQGTVGLCPRDPMPQRDWPGASVLPTESSKSWGQGASSSRHPAGVSGKQLWGLRCPARDQEDGRSLLSAYQPAGTFGNALGIPTAGAATEQAPVRCCGEHRKGSIGHVTCSVDDPESRRRHGLL